MSSSVFFSYSIFQDFFPPETGNAAQIHKHSLFFVFLSQYCGSHTGWKVVRTESFGWAFSKKKISFVCFFGPPEVRWNPTSETSKLSERLVFYFVQRWHEGLCLRALTLHLQSPSTHTWSNSMRLSKKMLELLNMCCAEPRQIFHQLLILERFSWFGSELAMGIPALCREPVLLAQLAKKNRLCCLPSSLLFFFFFWSVVFHD